MIFVDFTLPYAENTLQSSLSVVSALKWNRRKGTIFNFQMKESREGREVRIGIIYYLIPPTGPWWWTLPKHERAPSDLKMYGNDMMRLEKMRKIRLIIRFNSPKIRFGIRVPNFWAAAAAGSCDSVIFNPFWMVERERSVRTGWATFNEWFLGVNGANVIFFTILANFWVGRVFIYFFLGGWQWRKLCCCNRTWNSLTQH